MKTNDKFHPISSCVNEMSICVYDCNMTNIERWKSVGY